MSTPKSNEDAHFSDFDVDNRMVVPPSVQQDAPSGDYAVNGCCPECLNPVWTDCEEINYSQNFVGVLECQDYCSVCGWQGLTYYED